MAAVEFHLHQEGIDPGEGEVECNYHKSHSEGEENVEALVDCERIVEIVSTTCVWGEGSGREGEETR